jgi:hypothetical protein
MSHSLALDHNSSKEGEGSGYAQEDDFGSVHDVISTISTISKLSVVESIINID